MEIEISKRYKENEMRCPVHLSIGQETVPSILSININHKDFVVSTHRSHAHYLGKDGDLKIMIAEIYGKITGCSKGNGGSMHLIDKSKNFMGSTSIVGNSIPIGTGLALSSKLKKKKQIILMESKKDCGQNGTKMVKKEEKEILKMVKETVHGPLGMKTEIRNF